MDLRQFQYVLKIAEEKSFSEAARKLYIAQPYLSQYIISLEQRLGVALFDRTSIPIKLTYAGEIFVEKARHILSLNDELSHQIEDVAEYRKGRLTIGVSPTRGAYLLPKVLPLFYKNSPEVEIRLMEGTSSESEDWLIKGVTDLTITALPVQVEGIAYEVIQYEEVLIALPPNHRLAKNAEPNDAGRYPRLSLSLLQEEPFILLKQGQRLRQIADELFRKAGFKPRILIETKNFDTAHALTLAGLGVTFSLSTMGKFGQIRHPDYFSFDLPTPSRTIVIAYKQGKYISRITREFIDITKEALGFAAART